jgi:hypothetical protein
VGSADSWRFSDSAQNPKMIITCSRTDLLSLTSASYDLGKALKIIDSNLSIVIWRISSYHEDPVEREVPDFR